MMFKRPIFLSSSAQNLSDSSKYVSIQVVILSLNFRDFKRFQSLFLNLLLSLHLFKLVKIFAKKVSIWIMKPYLTAPASMKANPHCMKKMMIDIMRRKKWSTSLGMSSLSGVLVELSSNDMLSETSSETEVGVKSTDMVALLSITLSQIQHNP